MRQFQRKLTFLFGVVCNSNPGRHSVQSSTIWSEYLKDFIDQKRDEKMYKKVWSDISVYNTINFS